ncbi:MAG: helix-turn-helix domain-containing protein [Candidatus Binatia bacterium]
MAGRHLFSTLRARMSPEARARANEKARALRGEMELTEIRHAHQLSQEELASLLGVGQAAVAKLEKRTDMYISTLRRFIEAMGGELRIIAHFPDHDVHIQNFTELREKTP